MTTENEDALKTILHQDLASHIRGIIKELRGSHDEFMVIWDHNQNGVSIELVEDTEFSLLIPEFLFKIDDPKTIRYKLQNFIDDVSIPLTPKRLIWLVAFGLPFLRTQEFKVHEAPSYGGYTVRLPNGKDAFIPRADALVKEKIIEILTEKFGT